MNCLLCNRSSILRKNSHLVPHFIIANMVSEEAIRNKEIIFSFRRNDFPKNHLGRGVTPEKLDTIFKNNSEIETFNNTQNPFVMDDVFCGECEEKFQRIESLMASEIYNKFDKLNRVENTVPISPNQKAIITAFFISVFWRVSLLKLDNFSFSNTLRKRTKKLLFKILSLNSIIDNIKKHEREINSHIILVYSEIDTDRNNSKTKNIVHFERKNHCVYWGLVNEFIICYVPKMKIKWQPPFTLIDKLFPKTPSITNNEIRLINQIYFDEIIKEILDKSADDYLTFIRLKFRELIKKSKLNYNKNLENEFIMQFAGTKDGLNKYSEISFYSAFETFISRNKSSMINKI